MTASAPSGALRRLPPIGLGCAALGGLHGPVGEGDAAAALAAAWDAGIRYYDVAPLYGSGLGELRLGAGLRDRPRETYALSTKVGWRLHPFERAEAPAPGALPFRRSCDYGFDGTLRSVEDSLIRLGADRLDVALVHDIDPYNHGDRFAERRAEVLGGALSALARLREQGIVGAIGVAVNDCAVCLGFLRDADIDVLLLAGRYSLLDRSAEQELLLACAARGVPVIVGAPFNTGILAKRGGGHFNHGAAPPAVLERVEAMHRVCEAHGVTLMAAALQFPLRHPAVASVLPGPRSADQVHGIAAAFAEAIPEALWAELDAIVLQRAA